MVTFVGQDLLSEGRASTNIGGTYPFTPADHSWAELLALGIAPAAMTGSDYLYGGPVASGFTGTPPADATWGLGNDLLQGYGGSDVLYGGAGDDILFGHARPGQEANGGVDTADQLYGGAGDDWLSGYLGNDTTDGGDGSDTVVLAGLQSDYTFTGTAASFTATHITTGETETILNAEFVAFSNTFTDAAKVPVAIALDTTPPQATVNIVDTQLNDLDPTSLVTFTFSEVVMNFTLDDMSVMNGTLSDLVVAADGLSATATLTADDNFIGTGSVLVSANTFIDLAGNQNGFSNTDTVAINTVDSSLIQGTPGPDTLKGTPGSDVLYGAGGNDTLLGSAGADQMIGGSGSDTVRYTQPVVLDLLDGSKNTGQAAGDTFSSIEWFYFSNGNDKAYGDGANNKFLGANGNDLLHGRGGHDWLYGNNGNDTLYGQGGHDRLYGGNGNDRLYGGDGNDRLYGENGNDRLYGGDGNDLLSGGNGKDWLVGGLGRDKMNGNAGDDRYDFNAVEESSVGSQRDWVYLSGGDKIDLSTIDADTDTAGNQKFSWVDKQDLGAAFTGQDGQLRFANGILRGDIDGDKVADIEIRVVGWLSAGDLIL